MSCGVSGRLSWDPRLQGRPAAAADSTPSLGSSICQGCSHKKTQIKQNEMKSSFCQDQYLYCPPITKCPSLAGHTALLTGVLPTWRLYFLIYNVDTRKDIASFWPRLLAAWKHISSPSGGLHAARTSVVLSIGSCHQWAKSL